METGSDSQHEHGTDLYPHDDPVDFHLIPGNLYENLPPIPIQVLV